MAWSPTMMASSGACVFSPFVVRNPLNVAGSDAHCPAPPYSLPLLPPYWGCFSFSRLFWFPLAPSLFGPSFFFSSRHAAGAWVFACSRASRRTFFFST